MQTAYSKTAVGEEQMKNKVVTRCFTHNFCSRLWAKFMRSSGSGYNTARQPFLV